MKECRDGFRLRGGGVIVKATGRGLHIVGMRRCAVVGG